MISGRTYFCVGLNVCRLESEYDDAVFEGSVFVVTESMKQHERSSIDCIDVLDQGNFI